MCVKPRPHQQQRRSNTVECYKSNDSFDKVGRRFDIVAGVDGALGFHESFDTKTGHFRAVLTSETLSIVLNKPNLLQQQQQLTYTERYNNTK